MRGEGISGAGAEGEAGRGGQPGRFSKSGRRGAQPGAWGILLVYAQRGLDGGTPQGLTRFPSLFPRNQKSVSELRLPASGVIAAGSEGKFWIFRQKEDLEFCQNCWLAFTGHFPSVETLFYKGPAYTQLPQGPEKQDRCHSLLRAEEAEAGSVMQERPWHPDPAAPL